MIIELPYIIKIVLKISFIILISIMITGTYYWIKEIVMKYIVKKEVKKDV
jgi:hypothetical protein